jgi:3-hydroxyisobutyrate dehydrogenase-like beta-hydroxyacid dehydrogenase
MVTGPSGRIALFPRVAAFKLHCMKVVVMHPGAMGSAVAAALPQPVFWVPAGRSQASAQRAREAGLETVEDPRSADVILSICPPDQALALAQSLHGFEGVYVDANAVSPATAAQIAQLQPRYVDGGIIGPPPHQPGTTRLYLSGASAPDVAELFNGSILEARVVEDASALKMVYAAWTKGSAALLLATRASARELGVEADLLREWETLDLLPRLEAAERARTEKGWRWVGEMQEIADTFAAAGQPEGFHRAAADVYRVRRSDGDA